MLIMRMIPMVRQNLMSGLKTPLTLFKGKAQASTLSKRVDLYKAAQAEVRGKLTLWERLANPHPSLVIVVGQSAIWTLVSLVAYGHGLRTERLDKIERFGYWPLEVRERVNATFTYLTSGAVIMAATSLFAARNPTIQRLATRHPLAALAGSLGGAGAVAAGVYSIPYESTVAKHLAELVGLAVTPLALVAGPIVIRTAWLALGSVLSLGALSTVSPSTEFLEWTGPLGMGLGFVFVNAFGHGYIPPNTVGVVGTAGILGGLFLFSAMLMMNTKRAIKTIESTPLDKPIDPINAQMKVYLDPFDLI